jgi:hypothetical protein
MLGITRRSSIPGALGWLLGEFESIVAHASSDNQYNATYRPHRHALCESGSLA